MRPDLQKLCDDFIANRDTVNKAFHLEYPQIYPICANIFLSHGQLADADIIKNCKGYIKDHTSFVNNFRGSMYAPAACFLACMKDPDEKMRQAAENYKLLKKYFTTSEQLVLAAMLLTELGSPESALHKTERGKVLFDLMKKEHIFITGEKDSVFAVLLAFSQKNDQAIIDDIKRCLDNLKGMASRSYIRTVAQILSISDRPTDEKCARFSEIFNSLHSAGIKYGKSYELSVLASLSLSDVETSQLVSDIGEVSDFLKTQKGYGFLGYSKHERLMHAAMLVSTCYSPAIGTNTAALSATISIIVAEMIMMMVIIDTMVFTQITTTN